MWCGMTLVQDVTCSSSTSGPLIVFLYIPIVQVSLYTEYMVSSASQSMFLSVPMTMAEIYCYIKECFCQCQQRYHDRHCWYSPRTCFPPHRTCTGLRHVQFSVGQTWRKVHMIAWKTKKITVLFGLVVVICMCVFVCLWSCIVMTK
jgi:hypothetical protein